MRTSKPLLAGAVFAALAYAASPAAAQVPLGARALGLGGASLGAAQGQEALWENPAHLGLPGTTHWSVALPQVTAGATVTGVDLGAFVDMVQYDDLDAQRRQELLADVPAEGISIATDFRMPVATFQMRHFAFGASYGSIGGHSVGRDLVDLFLNGYQTGRTDYQVGNTAGTRATFIDLAVGHGRSVGPVSVGATAHYYVGRTLVHSRLMDPQYDIAGTGIDVTYSGVRADGGRGWGVDLGAAMRPMPGLTVSAAIENAASSMEWNDDLRIRRITFDETDIESTPSEDLWIDYRKSDAAFDYASASAEERALADAVLADADATQFPRTLKLGAAYAPGTGTTLTGMYEERLEDGRLDGGWARTVGVGVEQKVLFATVRAGASTDLEEETLLGAGLGLGPLQLGLARLSGDSAANADRAGWIVTFGLATGSNSRMP